MRAEIQELQISPIPDNRLDCEGGEVGEAIKFHSEMHVLLKQNRIVLITEISEM